jgi:CubicO group peptidase (beta-lactamase class C family)
MSRYVRRAETHGCAALCFALALGAGLTAHRAVAQQLPTASPEEVGMSSARLEGLDRGVQRWIDDGQIAGAVLLVARDGKVVHLSALGHRYREASDGMEVDDIFYIQSMTKSIVTTALMMLFEEGHFLLDDPISRYLPGFSDKMVATQTQGGVALEPAARPITFRHVLTHTSGVDPDRDLLTASERELLGRRSTLEETITARGPLPLAFHPGEAWEYGSSTDYVALLVERISGQSLDQFLQERILGPLGMVDTGYNVPSSKTARIVGVYTASGPGRTLELDTEPGSRPTTRYFGGVAGLFSTAADYLRFAQMILNGGELDGVRILSPTTVNLMVSNHVGDLPVRACVSSDGYGFGLSFTMVTDVGLSQEPLTPGSFGWCGAWNTLYWVDPTERVVMIMMTQLTNPGSAMRRAFPGLVMQAITESHHSGPRGIEGYPAIER